MSQGIALVVGIAILIAAGAGSLALLRRARSRSRLWYEASKLSESRRERGPFERWLALAGMRGAGMPGRFLAACLICAAAGLGLALLTNTSPALHSAAYSVAGLPVIGLVLSRIVLFLPWLAALSLAAAPVLVVRAARQRHVAAIEEDLPLLLELLATLGEAGLGFDGALDRVLDSEPAGRPLAQELRLFQAEVLGGGTRSECLKRLGRRIEVTTVTSAVAALVQAEETGSGLAEVLRPLADDLRMRRRERALARAEALPEKLVFPLVLGFLPGLLVWTLGPSFYQLFGIVDSIMRGSP